jgi:polynucleotide 5'-hydroxyl-kinase GRC3/NOL9
MDEPLPLHLPPDWADALARLREGGARRIVVLGPPDAGKSSFMLALAGAWAAPEPLALVDLDPGQKLVGPPGTVSLGHADEQGAIACTRFRYIGTTSALPIRAIADAAAELGRKTPLAANTSGFVTGPGARLQAVSIAALACDTVVAIGLPEPPLPKGWSGRLISLARSPMVVRKSDGLRRRNAALLPYLGNALLELPLEALRVDPSPPAPFADARRPLCALADADGEDMALAVIDTVYAGRLQLRCTPPPRPVARIRLGHMWVKPMEGRWSLADRLQPAWSLEP